MLYLQFIAAYKMKMKTDFLILRIIIFFTKSVLWAVIALPAMNKYIYYVIIK